MLKEDFMVFILRALASCRFSSLGYCLPWSVCLFSWKKIIHCRPAKIVAASPCPVIQHYLFPPFTTRTRYGRSNSKHTAHQTTEDQDVPFHAYDYQPNSHTSIPITLATDRETDQKDARATQWQALSDHTR